MRKSEIDKQSHVLAERFRAPGVLVDIGESLVFRVENGESGATEAWKLYPNLPLTIIEKYRKLTASVANHIDGKGIRFASLDRSQIYCTNLRVNPIKRVQLHEGVPLAISSWVEGASVSDLISNPTAQQHILQKIELSRPGMVVGELTEQWGKILAGLRWGFQGIPPFWITANNVKPVGQELVVTDLCASVANLANWK